MRGLSSRGPSLVSGPRSHLHMTTFVPVHLIVRRTHTSSCAGWPLLGLRVAGAMRGGTHGESIRRASRRTIARGRLGGALQHGSAMDVDRLDRADRRCVLGLGLRHRRNDRSRWHGRDDGRERYNLIDGRIAGALGVALLVSALLMWTNKRVESWFDSDLL